MKRKKSSRMMQLRAIKFMTQAAAIGMILVILTVIVDNRVHAHADNNIQKDPDGVESLSTSAPETTPEVPSIIPLHTEPTVIETTTEAAASLEETTTAPETAETETPAPETAPPETAPPETAPPAPPQPTYLGYSDAAIHGLSEAEITAISSQFDGNVRGYGGFEFYKNAQEVQNRLNAAGNVKVLCGQDKVVAFTFQEGWEAGHTGTILDILNSRGVKASFYVTHEYASHNTALVQRMMNEGHVVGNHSYSAPDEGMATRSLVDQMNDALRMQQYMQETFGLTMHGYNFNSGVYSDAAAAMYSQMGYTVIMSSVSYPDFNASEVIDPDSTLQKLEQALMPGTIYAFHTTNVVTSQFLGPLIDYCRAQGYTIVTLP